MKIVPFLLLSLFIGISCKQSDKDADAAESNIDAARKFIRYALDGKFKDAKRFMIEDSANMNYLNIAEQFYKKADPETRNGYRSASINIHEVTEPVKDSITVVIFSNSFKNDHDTLKVIHANGKWLVDLKYLFEHDMDTSVHSNIKKESLPK
jgi:hypothetical protein